MIVALYRIIKIFLIALMISLCVMPIYAQDPDWDIINIEQRPYKTWLVSMKSLQGIAIGFVFLEDGKAYDPKNKKGLTEFYTALFAEGAGPYDATEFKKLMADHHIQLSLMSTDDHMIGYMYFPKKHKDIAIKLLQYTFYEPRVDKDHMEYARKILVNSHLMEKNNPSLYAKQFLWREIFGEHPYAPPDNMEENLKNIEATDIISKKNTIMYKDNIFFTVVGDISEQQTLDIIDTITQPMPEKKPAYTPLPRSTYDIRTFTQDKANIHYIVNNLPQAEIFFSFPSFVSRDRYFYTHNILNNMMAGTHPDASLYKKIREEKSLTYGIHMNNIHYDYASVWYGRTSTNIQTLNDMLYQLETHIPSKQYLVDDKLDYYLQIFKKLSVQKYVFNFSSSLYIMHTLNYSRTQKRTHEYIRKRKKYFDDIRASDIVEAHNLIFGEESCTHTGYFSSPCFHKLTMIITGNKEGYDSLPQNLKNTIILHE